MLREFGYYLLKICKGGVGGGVAEGANGPPIFGGLIVPYQSNSS